MKRIINLSACCLFFALFGVQAQQMADEAYVLQSRAYQDSIVLRWVPKDLPAWRAMNKTGVTVKRTTLETGVEDVLATNLHPYDLATWKTQTDTTNIFVATAAQCVLGKLSVTPEIANQHFSNKLLAAKEQNNTLAFAAFSADFSTEAADGLAFRYVDKTIENKGAYSYTISVGSSFSNTSYARISKVWKPKPVEGVKAEDGNGEVQVFWPKRSNNAHFSGYYVERSLNNKDFERISKSIVKATISNTFSEMQRFADTNVENDATYYYRVIGVTSFADFGLYSEVVSATPIDRVPPPQIKDISVEAKNENSFELIWKLPQNLPNDFAGFRVLRSTKQEGPYELISETLLPKNTTAFTDKQAQSGTPNFYILIAEDLQGNYSETPPLMSILPDYTPPAQPKGLVGVIDSLGIVSLAWDFGNEEDLRGYRVYRSDAKDQEFEQLTKSPVPGNFYADTLKLKTLKSKIYYKVAAFDNNYNPSGDSEILELQRPDFLAPAVPNMKVLTFVNDSVNVHWKPSASKDVSEYQVWRKQLDNNWEIAATIPAPKTTFMDGQVVANSLYAYRITAIDDNGNISAPSEILRIRTVLSKLPTAPILAGQFDSKKKAFRLQWEYQDDRSLKKIVLLRNEGDGFLPYTTIDPSKTEFLDTQFFKNDKGYDYKIKTIDTFGTSSAFSNIVNVQFK